MFGSSEPSNAKVTEIHFTACSDTFVLRLDHEFRSTIDGGRRARRFTYSSIRPASLIPRGHYRCQDDTIESLSDGLPTIDRAPLSGDRLDLRWHSLHSSLES
ncbi:hypothetical protein KC362_g12 [Hortaea werneckii]|nr:hypothetical protein KC362_g12 [Hortaea werneckii]